ncbi:hypothetical protein [Streptomyces plumbiresistens]|uniref:Uncharacterized protein n=1 Tax=Streptomyces plumbiresistens TaxID=511811 RepID=A0ABP7Q086_9ACTN
MTTRDTPAAWAERDSAADEAVPPESYGTGTRLWTPRGRHRRPRPRKVLLAAGGLALAAGALSFVRLTPDAGVGSLGSAEVEPRPDPETGPERSADTAATVAAVTPEVSPSATTVLGGPSALPTRGVSLATPAPTAGSSRPTPTSVPEAPKPTGSAAPAAPRPPATSAAGTPAPAPSSTPTPPAPQPDHPDRPGLCLPVIAVCVDHPLAARHH